METQTFDLSSLGDRDLGFCVHLARLQGEAVAFWRPLGAACALALDERAKRGEDGALFPFPDNLTLADAALVCSELLLVICKLGANRSPDLLNFLQALRVAAGQQASTRAQLN